MACGEVWGAVGLGSSARAGCSRRSSKRATAAPPRQGAGSDLPCCLPGRAGSGRTVEVTGEPNDKGGMPSRHSLRSHVGNPALLPRPAILHIGNPRKRIPGNGSDAAPNPSRDTPHGRSNIVIVRGRTQPRLLRKKRVTFRGKHHLYIILLAVGTRGTPWWTVMLQRRP